MTFENDRSINIESLTHEHKASVDSEKLRIKKAGGKIEDSRVEGFLIVSRSLGVLKFKNNKTLE